ncbi:MAG TPA: thioredoxin domain-containing protein [Verrucomicrobiae bacterium]|nr:thioredoxin domain-containing protein [Verrucomicrobiae bacterium]
MFRASLLNLLGALLLVSADAPPKSAFDKATLEAYIRHLFLIQPSVTVTPGEPAPSDLPGFKLVKVRLSQGPQFQDVTLYVSNDGKKIVQGNIYDVANNPFKPDLDKLHTQFQPNLGTAGAPVVVVVFSDLQCPHCKGEAEMLRQNLIQNYPKDVRLYFKDFPIESLHPWAKAAAMAGRCIFAQSNDAFWAYHDWVFAHQDAITPTTLKGQVIGWAQEQKGLDVAKLSACMEKKTSEGEVDAEMKEARDLEISGTPTMFINGRRIPQSIDWPNLKNIIDTEIEYQKVAKNAGDDCGCEVQLPVPAALGKPASVGFTKKK